MKNLLLPPLIGQELVSREQEGQLDEGFLSEVNAQLRQVSLHSSFKKILSSINFDQLIT